MSTVNIVMDDDIRGGGVRGVPKASIRMQKGTEETNNTFYGATKGTWLAAC